MTAHQQLTALFQTFPGSGSTLPALARAVLALAARAGDLTLPGPGGSGDLVGLHPRLLRPFLAALGFATAAAAGVECNPYSGRYTLELPADDGTLTRLAVVIENTPGVQRFEVIRMDPATAASVRPASAAPAHLAPIA